MAQTFQSAYSSTLSLPLSSSATTITVAVAPTVTKGRIKLGTGSVTEYISFTGNPTPGGTNITLTGVTRNLSKTADPSTGGTGLSWIAGTPVKIVAMHDQLADKREGTTYDGIMNFVAGSGRFQFPSYTTTQRDAVLTWVNGDVIYNSTTGTDQQYVGGAWADFGTSTTPNADTTTAGKVEEATDVEFTAGTSTGGTGAKLFATLVQLAKSISLKPLVTVATPSSDKIAVAYSDGSDKSILISDFVNQVPATTSVKGFVEMATDAEVITGTDQTRYVNPKQLREWRGYTVSAGGPSIASSPSVTSGSTVGDILKSFNVGFSGSVLLGFDALDDSNNGSNAIIRLFKNNVDTGQSVSISFGAGTYTNGLGFSVSVASGDNLQLRVGNSNVINVRNAYLAAQITPVSLTATVVL